MPPPTTYTAQAVGSVWLDFRLTTTGIFKPNSTRSLILFGLPNGLTVDVYTPTGNESLGELDWTYGKVEHFTSPVVEVNEVGTYRFVIKNGDSDECTGVLTPNVEWQLLKKPYFYYGLAGLIIQ